MVADELPDLIVADGDAWQEWLGAHPARSTGVWLVPAKKGTTDPTASPRTSPSMKRCAMARSMLR
jgi:hypothetical protein